MFFFVILAVITVASSWRRPLRRGAQGAGSARGPGLRSGGTAAGTRAAGGPGTAGSVLRGSTTVAATTPCGGGHSSCGGGSSCGRRLVLWGRRAAAGAADQHTGVTAPVGRPLPAGAPARAGHAWAYALVEQLSCGAP
ncbi:hypothetical protein ACRAWF_04870 [Streptomyces sp. L7]